MAIQCEYRKKGKQCRAYAILNSEFCFMHDPSKTTQRAKARKKGGKNRRVNKRSQSEYHLIKSIKDINEILESAINEARSLESSQSNLRTLAYLCQIAMKGQELGSLEERVGIIENNIEEMREGYAVKNTYS